MHASNRPASRALSSSLTIGPGDADNVVESGVEADDDAAATTTQQRQQPLHQQQAASVPDFLLRRSMVGLILLAYIHTYISFNTTC